SRRRETEPRQLPASARADASGPILADELLRTLVHEARGPVAEERSRHPGRTRERARRGRFTKSNAAHICRYGSGNGDETEFGASRRIREPAVQSRTTCTRTQH